jgi:hypothetical protein
MNKLIVPSLIAALAVFIWGSISWMVLSWHNIDIKNFTDETEIMNIPVSQLMKPMPVWKNG